jgi:hypothetical protein
MALTFYQKNVGPRWHVTDRVKDSNGHFPPDIDIDDALSFEGAGTGAGDCKLINVTKNTTWGEECTHPHPDIGRTNRVNEVEMKRPITRNKWIITRSKLPSPSDRYQIVATPSSGGGSWTATKG